MCLYGVYDSEQVALGDLNTHPGTVDASRSLADTTLTGRRPVPQPEDPQNEGIAKTAPTEISRVSALIM
jgi:hypothetical protein